MSDDPSVRTDLVHARVTRTEYRAVIRAAANAGLTASDWVRRLITDELRVLGRKADGR